MSKDSDSRKDGSEGESNPVKEMFLLAALYMPMGFFLWFFAASLLMLPARIISQLVLTTLHGDLFERIFQSDFYFEIHTTILVPNPDGGADLPLTWDVNPMLYAWGMALMFGLIMATPLKAGQRIVQLLIGFSVVSVVTIWGVYWETWRDLAFLFGPDARAAVDASAMSPTVIALFYQLGYLMFPAVIPIATWILMNRDFIETKVVRHKV
ncbi:MAG: exosortase H-associated membrane protein [Pseudomonadota bacterium]